MTTYHFDEAKAIARTYLDTHQGKMPPMLIGFNAEGESITLLGTFRDFPEQLTFCSIARMAFILYDIVEYHVLTHGDMKYEDDKTQPEVYEVLMDAAVNKYERIGKVFRIISNDGKVVELHEEMDFDTLTGGLDGMFLEILPTKNVKFDDNLITGIEQYVSQVRYVAPEIIIPAPTPTTILIPEEPNVPTALANWRAVPAT